MPDPTWPASQSAACRPQNIISNCPIFSMALTKALAVVQLSPPSKDLSSSNINSSAPIDSGLLATLMSRFDPMLKIVILPPCLSLILRAASTAFASKGLITSGTLGGGITLLLAASILKLDGGASGSIICLQHTIMFIDNDSSNNENLYLRK